MEGGKTCNRSEANFQQVRSALVTGRKHARNRLEVTPSQKACRAVFAKRFRRKFAGLRQRGYLENEWRVSVTMLALHPRIRAIGLLGHCRMYGFYFFSSVEAAFFLDVVFLAAAALRALAAALGEPASFSSCNLTSSRHEARLRSSGTMSLGIL